MRRVVVTGLGLLTPLGQGVDVTWKNILAGKSGANRITAFDPTDYACQVACEVPRIDGRGGGGAQTAQPTPVDRERPLRRDAPRFGQCPPHGRTPLEDLLVDGLDGVIRLLRPRLGKPGVERQPVGLFDLRPLQSGQPIGRLLQVLR